MMGEQMAGHLPGGGPDAAQTQGVSMAHSRRGGKASPTPGLPSLLLPLRWALKHIQTARTGKPTQITWMWGCKLSVIDEEELSR